MVAFAAAAGVLAAAKKGVLPALSALEAIDNCRKNIGGL
jgi:hypothetical protein